MFKRKKPVKKSDDQPSEPPPIPPPRDQSQSSSSKDPKGKTLPAHKAATSSPKRPLRKAEDARDFSPSSYVESSPLRLPLGMSAAYTTRRQNATNELSKDLSSDVDELQAEVLELRAENLRLKKENERLKKSGAKDMDHKVLEVARSLGDMHNEMRKLKQENTVLRCETPNIPKGDARNLQRELLLKTERLDSLQTKLLREKMNTRMAMTQRAPTSMSAASSPPTTTAGRYTEEDADYEVSSLTLRAEGAEKRAIAIQNELNESVKRYGKELASLKARLSEKDAQIFGGFGSLANLQLGEFSRSKDPVPKNSVSPLDLPVGTEGQPSSTSQHTKKDKRRKDKAPAAAL